MNSVFLSAILVVMLVAFCSANPECACDPQAGCKDIGCECTHEGEIYEPYTHPEQAELPAGCRQCPPVYCPSMYARVSCNGVHECEEFDMVNLVKKV